MGFFDHGFVSHLRKIDDLTEQCHVVQRRIAINAGARRRLECLREERLARVLLSMFVLLERKGLISREELKAEYERILELDQDRDAKITLNDLLLYAGVMNPGDYVEETRILRRMRTPQRK